MNISKKVYNELVLDAKRYKFLKYDARPDQWLTISNVDSVEKVDELLDLFIDEMWDDEE